MEHQRQNSATLEAPGLGPLASVSLRPSNSLPSPAVRGNYIYFLYAFFFMAVLPLVLLWPVLGAVTVEFVLALVILEYSAYRLTRLAFQPQQSFMEIAFWIFVYCWLGLSAAGQSLVGVFPWPNFKQTTSNLIYTNLTILAGLVAYELSMWFARKRPAAKLISFQIPTLQRLYSLTALCLLLSSWGIFQQGGIGAVMVPRHQVGEDLVSSSNDAVTVKRELLTASAMQHTPPAVALLVVVYLFSNKRYRTAYAVPLGILLITLIGFNSIANYPPSLARVQLGSMLVSLAVVAIGDGRTLRQWFIIGLALALTVVFPYTDYFRAPVYDDVELTVHPIDTMIEKGDYDAFQMISNTIAAVNDNGVDYGYHLLGSALFFIPRDAWPAKPNGTGADVGEAIGYTFLNLSSPLWAEFYNAGGLVAVVLGFIFYARLSNWVQVIGRGSGPAIVLTGYAAGFQIYLLRGDLMNTIAYFSPGLVLLCMFVVKTTRSEGEALYLSTRRSHGKR